jgi:hypothetical protein
VGGGGRQAAGAATAWVGGDEGGRCYRGRRWRDRERRKMRVAAAVAGALRAEGRHAAVVGRGGGWLGRPGGTGGASAEGGSRDRGRRKWAVDMWGPLPHQRQSP